jgi:hypothetical protein
LLKKEILSKYHFPNNIKNYGYEDLVFIKQLKENKVPIQHYNNMLIHFNSETSIAFLNKTEDAVKTLHQLISNKKLLIEDIKIGKASKMIHLLHLESLARFLFKKTSTKLIANLTSSHPSLIILDLYKLGYFLNLK